MPTTDANKAVWDGKYDWKLGGEEWSEAWGTSATQWHGTILPRIQGFLPAGTILEIGPGFGRWSRFLKDLCGRLFVVDLAEQCVQACRARFAEAPHVQAFVNDGRSLDMIPDDTVDFLFSFDSLVHVDEPTLAGYVAQFRRKLRPDGVAFVHHSNLGSYANLVAWQRNAPWAMAALSKVGLLDNIRYQWRDPGVSAATMRALSREHGLSCVSQELVTWSTRRVLIDCISTLVRADSRLARPTETWRNFAFMEDARRQSAISRLYHWPSPA